MKRIWSLRALRALALAALAACRRSLPWKTIGTVEGAALDAFIDVADHRRVEGDVFSPQATI